MSSSELDKLVEQLSKTIRTKGLPFVLPKNKPAEESLKMLFKTMMDKIEILENEEKALIGIIGETSDLFQERISELSLVRRLGEELDIFMSLDDFYHKLLEILIEELGAENCSIMIVDKNSKELVLQVGRCHDKDEFRPPKIRRRIKLGKGIAGHVAASGEAMLVTNVKREPRFASLRNVKVEIGAILCIPFPSTGEVLGVINLSHPDPDYFTENNKRLLSMLANQIAMAITNNSMLKAEQEVSKNNLIWAISSLVESNRRLKTVSEVSRLISSSLDLEETLNVILVKVVEVLQAEKASLLLLDDETGDLVVETAIGRKTQNLPNTRLRTGESISGYVAETGKPILVRDIESDSRIKRTNRPRYSTKSLISVPLLSKNQTIGVLNVSDKTDESSFTENDLELVMALASQITIAIQNAAMFEKKKQAVVELETIHDVNEKIQRAVDITNALEMIMDSIAKITDYSFSLFYHWDVKKDQLALKHFRGISESKAKEYDVKFGSEFTSLIEENPNKLCKNPKKYFPQLMKLPMVKKARFLGFLPIVTEEKFFGLLIIGKNSGRDYSSRDMNFLRIISSQAAAVYKRSISLISASQLITLGEIMGSAMHDLKNPLTAIKGAIQLLQQKKDDVGFTQKGLEIMANSAQHLDELIDGYFSITSSKMTNFQHQNVNNVLKKIHGTIKSRFSRSKIKLKLDLAENVPACNLDFRQMSEAFHNLLINALQALEDKGGEVIISTRFLELPENNNVIEITFKDNGPGILKKYQEKIFERFFTTKESGTGLGLPIVSEIVKTHLGSIEVSSKPHEGTAFTIKLPVNYSNTSNPA